jgi:hypothetical protein
MDSTLDTIRTWLVANHAAFLELDARDPGNFWHGLLREFKEMWIDASRAEQARAQRIASSLTLDP